MIVSRGIIFFKASNHVLRNQLFKNGRHELRKQIARESHGEVYYRKQAPPNPKVDRIAEALGAFMWWWLIWHYLTDYHMFYGPKFPDPSSWTNEELGIPPDDED